MSECLFHSSLLRISPPLRSQSRGHHSVGEVLDRPVSGRWQDASTANRGLKRHHLLLLPLRPSAEFPAAYATSCGWRIVISPATGHVTLLHSVLGLARIELVVADSKGIGVG